MSRSDWSTSEIPEGPHHPDDGGPSPADGRTVAPVGGALGMGQSGAWRVVSTYQDGDRIIESPCYTDRADAEKAAESVRVWRDRQDEMPRVEIEECKP